MDKKKMSFEEFQEKIKDRIEEFQVELSYPRIEHTIKIKENDWQQNLIVGNIIQLLYNELGTDICEATQDFDGFNIYLKLRKEKDTQ